MEEENSSSISNDVESFDYKVSKRKKKSWKRNEPLLAGTTLCCSKCEYKTILPQHMRWHEKRHGRKTGHKCPLCSYSLKHKIDIYLHVRNHHSGIERDRILSERNDIHQAGDEEDNSVEWLYLNGNGARIKAVYCGDCDFKSTRQNVTKHAKRMHPNSTTALPPPPPPKPEKVLLKCPHCDYSTMRKAEFERHEINHRQKFTHQCTLCSYSADGWQAIGRHAKYYHSNTSSANSKIQRGNVDDSSLREKEEWYYCSNGSRMRYQFCRDCDYKSTKRTNLEKHVKMLHPFSTTALPPPLGQPALYHCTLCQYETHSKRSFREHQLHHRKKYAHRCQLCSYSAKSSAFIDRHLKHHHPNQEEVADPKAASKVVPTFKCSECEYSTSNSSGLKLHEKGHNRNEEFKCSRCNFSSEYEYVITRHLERHHSKEKSVKLKLVKRSSKIKFEKTSPNFKDSNDNEIEGEAEEVETQSSTKSSDKAKFKCSLCGFSSLLITQMEVHQHGHIRKGEFKCSICSFSSDSEASINIHLQDCHTLKERKEGPPKSIMRRTSSHNSSARKTQATLDRFFGRRTADSSCIKVEIEEEEIPQCNIQLLRLNKEQEAKLLDLQCRIQVMQTKVITAQKELKEITSKKRDVFDKMKEIAAKKVKIEYDLRARQCEALELSIMSLDNEAGHNAVVLAEYSVMCLEDEMKMFEDELQSLREQDANLIDDVEEAEGSFIGTNQVLFALMFELDSLLNE